MKILFIGQKGIPCTSPEDKVGRERRVEALATRLASKGHKVTVTCARPYAPKSINKFNGVWLRHIPSFYPEVAGGWWYDLLSVLSIVKLKPAVVHMSGWRMAALSPLAVVLRPSATYIWTIDKWPERRLPVMKWVARVVDGLFDAITAPSRELQHKILHFLQIRAIYVPDGYSMEAWPALGLTKFGIRMQRYNLTTAVSAAEIRGVATAYKKAGLKTKLVVMVDEKGPYKRLKKKFPFLHFTGQVGERARQSLIEKSWLVILEGGTTALNTVLAVMDSGKAVVATTRVGYQEVLGVTALMVKEGDIKGLEKVLKTLTEGGELAGALGRQAQKRARTHFTWQRILPEYVELYHYPLLKPVWLDSARAKLVAKKA